MHVPQELVDLIVDNLHDDIPSLKSCSLTARAFVGSAQTWIFNKVEILPPKNRDDQDGPCEKFYELLMRSPHIASLVDESQIVLVGSETSFAFDEERHVPWVMFGETLSLVLALLDLRRISLVENLASEWNALGEFSMDWNQLGRSLKSALATVFSSPKLESVCLRGIVVQSPVQLLSLFSEATSLKKLSISRAYFTQHQSHSGHIPWKDSEVWRPQLQSLLVSDLHLCHYLLDPRIDLTHITSLTISGGSTKWMEKMTQAAISATHLALYHPHRLALKPSLTASLRSIHFFSLNLHLLIPYTFEACLHNSHLEKIVCEGPTGKFHNRRRRPSTDETIEAAMPHLGALRSVEIRAYMHARNPRPFHEWADEARAILPSLVRRGLLILTKITREYREPHWGWE
ncbi:hypothetical protein C8R45DRAFT_1003919 [Mycena sanguinolenta]|nr:hypothetical protein C8R45DRAFT_1003919 [Mycena sanguinolenta]